MTPITPPTTPPESPQDAPRWPLDTLEGSHLILEAFHAVMTGPAAGAYVRQSMAGTLTLDLDRAMDDAEGLAAQAFKRSFNRAGTGPLGDFFKQTVRDQR